MLSLCCCWQDHFQSLSTSSSRSHLVVGVAAADTILLQPVLSWTSSFVVPMALMSRFTQFIHLCFCLPRFLLQGGTISRVCLPTWSRLFTWPNQLSRAFLHLSAILSTFSNLIWFSRNTRRVPVQRAALCIRNFPSQYRNHFRGLSGHDAGNFNATVFISMLSGGRAGVSINSPAAANTSLL